MCVSTRPLSLIRFLAFCKEAGLQNCLYLDGRQFHGVWRNSIRLWDDRDAPGLFIDLGCEGSEGEVDVGAEGVVSACRPYENVVALRREAHERFVFNPCAFDGAEGSDDRPLDGIVTGRLGAAEGGTHFVVTKRGRALAHCTRVSGLIPIEAAVSQICRDFGV